MSTRDLLKNVSYQLMKLRIDKGLSRTELAEKSGMDYQIISNMEDGDKDMFLDDVINLVQSMGCKVSIEFKDK